MFIKSLRILFIQFPTDFKKLFLRHAADFRFRDDLLQQFSGLFRKFFCLRKFLPHPCAAPAVSEDIAFLFEQTIGFVDCHGIDPDLFHFEGTARVFESQDEAVHGILSGKVKPGDVVVIRYEGPKGGPGMQEMLYPTSYLKTVKLDKDCALITDGRFSGGTSGLSIGHVSPEAASGGEIALIHDNDKIVIDIISRSVNLQISEAEMKTRKESQAARGKAAYTPAFRKRNISEALKIYALHVSSADIGAVRFIE